MNPAGPAARLKRRDVLSRSQGDRALVPRRLATISSVKLFPTVFTFPRADSETRAFSTPLPFLLKRGFCFDVKVANEAARLRLHSGDLSLALRVVLSL